MKILGIIITLLLLCTLVGCVGAGGGGGGGGGGGTATSKPTVDTLSCTDLATTSLTAQGQVTGGAPVTRRGFYYDTAPLYGLQFNGINSTVKLPAGSQPTGAFTLAIWCKPTDWNNADDPQLFGGRGLRKYEDGLSGITISRYLDKLCFDVADENTAERKTIAINITNIAPAGKWSFIVLTNSGLAEPGGLKLYRNSAVPVGNTTGAVKVRWLDSYAFIGGALYSSTLPFKGIISEVHIYDRALNAAEIKALYSGQDVTGDLRGYWKLDEGSGNITADSSGNGNNGSLVKGPVWYTGGDIVDETGNFGTGIYSLAITGLETDTSCWIMAFAENAKGTGYGKVTTCMTLK
ncbi:MAG: LamG domain-containing protein [Dehalococcoidia bacterium]